MDQDFFLHLSSSILAKTVVFVSSITFFDTIYFGVALFIWATNRQTQIRPSKSQKREEHTRTQYVRIKDQNLGKDKGGTERDSGLFSSRKIVRNQSLDFSAMCDQNDLDNEIMSDSEHEDGDFDGIGFSDDDNKVMVHTSLKSLQNSMKEDIMTFLSTMNVFSYLSDEAFKELSKDMRYIDLPEVGSPIRCQKNDNDKVSSVDVDDSILDGSFYIVITGSVQCICQFEDTTTNMAELYRSNYKSSTSPDQTKLQITLGPGELVTSQLAMLSDLIRWYQERNGIKDKSSMSNHPVRVNAYTTEKNTRLVCVPSVSFLSILEKFPHEVHQIAQTILARTQRVTMLTLVKSLGLINEVTEQKLTTTESKDVKHWLNQNDCDKNINWCRQECQSAYYNISSKQDVTPLDVPEEIKQNVSMLAAWQLGTTKNDDIESIKKNSSIIAVNPGVSIVHTGMKSNFVYFIIGGELELGNYSISNEKGLESQRPLGISMKTLAFDPKKMEQDNNVSFQVSQHLKPGVFASELPVFTGEVSMVTVRASAKSKFPSYLLQMAGNEYSSLLSTNTSVLIQSLNTILRLNFSPVVHLLDWGLRWRDVQVSSILARKGEPCESLFVVLNGRLRSGDYNEDNPSMESEYGRGICIGEVQVLTGDVWPHDVFAIRNSELAEIPVEVLEFIMNIFPSCGVHFARVMANHVQRKYPKKDSINIANSRDNRLPSYKLTVATIAIVPLCFEGKDDDLSCFCQNIVASLEQIAPSILVTKALIKQKLGKIDNVKKKNFNDMLKLARILGDIEENNRLVVFQADVHHNWWTKTCIEHSDCVILVIDSQKAPNNDSVIKFLSKIQLYGSLLKRVDLVVLTKEADDVDISICNDLQSVSLETHEWIERLPFDFNINMVRDKTKNDINRMCRRITGFSLGLVLGGGGARGIAHLGVIKALLDAGVAVDIIGGTSQGAFIGALCAKYPDSFDKLISRVRMFAEKMSSVREKVLDLTIPLVSYFNGKRFNQSIIDAIGIHTQIQYLPLKFFCVSTDLCNYCQAVHTTGCCWKYVS
jgi:CRP-like cAMP-binding protein